MKTSQNVIDLTEEEQSAVAFVKDVFVSSRRSRLTMIDIWDYAVENNIISQYSFASDTPKAAITKALKSATEKDRTTGITILDQVLPVMYVYQAPEVLASIQTYHYNAPLASSIAISTPAEPVRMDKDHLNMILATHELADAFNCFSYVGTIERSKLGEKISDVHGIPDWIAKIANQAELRDIEMIDNIWFHRDDDGRVLPYPFLVFEHERSGNMDAIARRISSLQTVLDRAQKQIREVSPLCIIVAPDAEKCRSYYAHLEARARSLMPVDFYNQFSFIPIDAVTQRNNQFLNVIVRQMIYTIRKTR